MNSTTSKTADLPLCVDCDGTLTPTDLLYESAFLLLKQSPLSVFQLPFWLASGKAHMKGKIASLVQFNWATIPLNPQVVESIHAARAAGRRVVLATASHRLLADPLAKHLGLFDEVVATEGSVNLSGARKADRLVGMFGERGFDYAGNSRDDLPVWAVSRAAIVVSAEGSLKRQAEALTQVDEVITPDQPSVKDYAKALRLHQWLKNLLLFVPLLAAHRLLDVTALTSAGLAFIAFSLCASAVYLLNDLLDLESDREHIRKRKRPFASAKIPLWTGIAMIPALLLLSGLACLALPPAFTVILAAYFVLTMGYSFWLKKQVVVDVLMLAALYTVRVVAGGAATGIVPSFWLLLFSMFIFLSLALVKRYSEMYVVLKQNKSTAAGRGYRIDDLPVLMSAGTSSGMVAVLVISLYINNVDTLAIYGSPQRLWPISAMLLYWVTRLWMKTHRGEIDDDPVVFALKDWQSIGVLVLSALCFVAAA